MKKLILPLLLLVAFGMLAAVESDPSNVVGYVKYPCYTGNNYVAYPMGEATTAEGSVVDYIANFGAIAMWSNSGQTWTSISYDADFAEWSGTMPLNNAGCMTFNSLSNFDFYSLGTPSDAITFGIYAGNNRIYVPLDRSDLGTAEELGDEVGNIIAVAWYTNSTHSWASISYDPDFMEWSGTHAIAIGDPLTLNSTAATTWPGSKSTGFGSSFKTK
ncbi:MAG: hypothetical protein LHW45_00910 [Candidatus Cloacimonetes bacterium]|nr:hypothetical protein [Candidatus Cloacimonadota bacterium]MDY0366179.1 hypothetical protein [Candidatus Syntrophosphaera sp.]